MKDFKTINDYIKSFPESTQVLLKKMRKTITEAAPTADEAIRYGMPTFRLNDRNLVHFAGYAKHIGFYPAPSGIIAFKKELFNFKTSKGAIQFPISEELPLALIKKIVKYRVKENAGRIKK
ncbi:MAG: DUF1801 domain-containing protein [Patescibacteria group bacterium]